MTSLITQLSSRLKRCVGIQADERADLGRRLSGDHCRPAFLCWLLLWAVAVHGIAVLGGPSTGYAQTSQTPIVDASEIQSVLNDAPEPEPGQGESPSGIDLLSLIFRGGVFMIPIAIMSLLVVTLAVERMLTLRSRKIIPRRLVRELRTQMMDDASFQPSKAFLTCEEFPSVASRVVKAMLMRTGAPVADAERAATETAQREADRYASPIRWLNLAAAATPLMGLLGTVWGMIVAFHESTTLTPDRSRSEQLSEGIYTALVTTLAGLIVAIPAAILAQHLENKLTRLFGRVEQLAFDLAPALNRFVGNTQMRRDGSLHPMADAAGDESTGGRPPQVATGSVAGRTKTKSRGGIQAG
ncbi:MotA/TolQ/ExbB proton channel family protein [Crateriforma conspicua]|uniref:MotA/TolQ/ExbB proton channel family protein n=1 Tax=Crateriforma conspicua TaxID=2527996 RepID=UPI0011891539|nr:MotA/TolQ/ExbB proton channel family protein [Crateriforma conspicua]QDV65684.1 colicin uptake protein TolQ [Crateriforma conspicua]